MVKRKICFLVTNREQDIQPLTLLIQLSQLVEPSIYVNDSPIFQIGATVIIFIDSRADLL
jgi:hypothetical protein